uniref:Pseudouridine synthase n=1 Tax=uncultured Bacillota bacterium TaxID=344338 RepID=A0A650EPI4_9FIRM|nr:pseudouridine synthase [uncultured Firmicutes bacterium]
MKQVCINQNDAGQRLDKFLDKFLVGMPKSMLYKAIRKKRVKVNGKKGELSQRLNEGDILQLYINDEFFREEQREIPAWLTVSPKLKIVFEDENLLIVDKPSGLVAHASAANGQDSLIGRICAYLYQKGDYHPERENTFAPALCHRIDRNTSGLVIAAKNAAALRMMNEKIREKEVRKFYLCRTEGIPQPNSGTLTNWMIKDSKTNRVQAYDTAAEAVRSAEGGKAVKAITRYQVLRQEGKTALVEAELLTGKTHQIRAQMAHAGYPLFGDVKYGAEKNGRKDYQQLRAYRLIFDFQTDAGILNGLKGKEIRADLGEFGGERCGMDKGTAGGN